MTSSFTEPTSPVRIPKSVSNYTPSTLDPELRSSVNSRLLTDGHITKIHDTFLHALHASPTNWPTLIQTHALTLLRNGECTTFHELLERVLQDIQTDTLSARSSSKQIVSNSRSKADKRIELVDKKVLAIPESGTIEPKDNKQSLAVPTNVVEQALKITRECLENICEIDD
ncbi:hypothetical protein K3495_g6973 [Podosphaera aphanis]|nr:hypothetical protein K3495_g6973 [Podosphaera aphanis]